MRGLVSGGLKKTPQKVTEPQKGGPFRVHFLGLSSILWGDFFAKNYAQTATIIPITINAAK